VLSGVGVLSTFLFAGVGLWALKISFTWWLGVVVFILIGFMAIPIGAGVA